jgi:predicted metal-dependent phosphoesterase TrpH
MLKYDLHCHSTRSDGVLEPRELVARAAARGVEMLALTDHDEIGGLAEARHEAGRAGLIFVDGVEISVDWDGHTLHVVGLQIDPGNRDLASGLDAIRSGRAGRAVRIAAGLAAAGIEGSLEGAYRYVTNEALVGRAHFARFLVERGYASDIAGVFRKFLTPGRPGYVPHQWASLGDAMSWINASGGIPVLAHPGRYKLNNKQRETLLDTFKALGGVAVEVVTGSHTAEQYAAWGHYAQRFGLHASVGSDFHGPEESYRDLGALPPLPVGCQPVWELF